MLGTIRNAEGELLDYTAVQGGKRDELVLIGHGVTGNKDRDWAVALSNALGQAGFDAVRFSFSGNGASEGSFRESTVSKEVEDLGSVLDAVSQDSDRTAAGIVYVGHSMGGAVGVLRAARDRRITRLVSLAGMVETGAFAQRKFGDLTPDRDVMWEKPECPLSQSFMDDMARIGTVIGEVPNVQVPWLLLHGTADTVVPLSDSEQAHRAASENSTLIKLPDVDHVFTGEGTALMIEQVLRWLH